MSGVAKVGTAAGQMARPPLAAMLIVWLGWRDAVTAMGAGAIVLLLIAALSMKSPPAATGDAAKAEYAPMTPSSAGC